MDRLYRRIREGLGDGPRRPYPDPLPAREAAPDHLLDRFREALEKVGGRLIEVADEAEAMSRLTTMAGGGDVICVEDGADDRALARAAMGVDRADLLIAETGTVLRTYRTREESRISLAPAASAFLATREDLVAALPDALERTAPLHRAGRAYTLLITGPSRTADIEKELVIPAHGPRELIVAIVARS